MDRFSTSGRASAILVMALREVVILVQGRRAINQNTGTSMLKLPGYPPG